MKKIDYSFLSQSFIPSHTTNLLGMVEAKYGKFKLLNLKYPNIFKGLSKTAFIESVQSSNQIANIFISRESIIELLDDKSPHKLITNNQDEQAILGYIAALKSILSKDPNKKIGPDLIIKLYQQLFFDQVKQGLSLYKDEDSAILINQLFFAYGEALKDPEISLLLLIPCCILDLMIIKPFDKGNGRISRLFTTLLLFHSGYDFVKYLSFEKPLSQDLLAFNEAIIKSTNNYFDFIDYFLSNLVKTLDDIDKRFRVLIGKNLTKEERIKETILASTLALSKKDLLTLWPDISISTMDKTLIKLQKDLVIKKIGLFKDAKYFKY